MPESWSPFSKGDPDAGLRRLRILPWALAGGVLGAIGGGVRLGALGFLGGFAIGTAVAYAFTMIATEGVAGLVQRTLQPSGSTTPYAFDFSQIEAQVVRGDHAAAAVLWEDAIAERPGDVEVRVRAADFYGDVHRQHERALALYREVQRLEAPPERHLYVAQRIVDLLLGPLPDKGRAVVELRRIIDRWPNSAAARHGRDAIARLKAELHDGA